MGQGFGAAVNCISQEFARGCQSTLFFPMDSRETATAHANKQDAHNVLFSIRNVTSIRSLYIGQYGATGNNRTKRLQLYIGESLNAYASRPN